MNSYLDTSILVSLYVPELHTTSIVQVIKETKGSLVISKLCETEFYSTLSKKRRTKEMTSTQIADVIKVFSSHIDDGAYVMQLIDERVFDVAISFLKDAKSSLRTLDALHLAASKVAKCRLITADKVLAECANLHNVPIKVI